MLRRARGSTQAAPSQAAIIFTVAGNGTFGFGGDGGPATSASLALPRRAMYDAQGNLLIADVANHRIRRVDADSGIVRTIAGNGLGAFGGDGCPAVNASLFRPTDIASDTGGNVFIADQENHRVRRVDAATGVITTFAGNGTPGYAGDGGSAVEAELHSPTAIALGADGRLFIVDRDNHRIRVVSRDNTIDTVAGDGSFGFRGDGGAAREASFTFPRGVDVDSHGNVYVADVGNNRIRVIDQAGIIWTAAGSGDKNFQGDGGPATRAGLAFPICVRVDNEGNIMIADRFNHRLRRVDAVTGVIRSIAGTGRRGFGGDRGSPEEATLSFPNGVDIDRYGRILIADLQNHRIRCIQTAAQGIAELLARTESLGRIPGASAPQDGKLQNLQRAAAAVAERDYASAFRLLMQFQDMVEAQRGFVVSNSQADALIARASIIRVILTQHMFSAAGAL